MMIGSGSLPINLASALSLHGVPNNDSGPSSSGARSGGTNNAYSSIRNTRKKTNIQALTVHPSLPRVAYLEEETVVTTANTAPTSTASSSSKKNKSSPTTATSRTSIKSQRLVIQQYKRQSNGSRRSAPSSQFYSNKHAKNNNNITLASLPMENLPPQINQFRQPKSKSSKMTNQPLTLASLGPLQSITFLDREGLFWQTRRQYGALSNLEMGGAALLEQGDNNVVLSSDNADWNNGEGGGMMMGQDLCLGLQFSRVLVVLRFHKQQQYSCSGDGMEHWNTPFTVLCCLEGQRTVTSGKESKVQYTPTSAATPISNSIVVYGCSDGAMRFHNLVPSMLFSSKSEISSSSPASNSSSSSVGNKSSKQTRQATIKSVRGPNGRNDPVVKIVNVDPAYNESNQSRGETTPIGIPTQVGTDVVTVSDDATLVIRSRLLTVCASGVAFLWDVHVMIDRSSGALRDLNVLPPLVRLDGLGSLTISPRKTPAVPPQARNGGFWGGITKDGNNNADAPYFQGNPSISYDPHRHLLIWALPSDAPVSSIDHRGDYDLESLTPNSTQAKKEREDRAFMNTWALENGGFVKVWDLSLVEGLIHSAAASTPGPRPPPKMPPIAIIKLPPSVSSAASPLSMIAGLSHAPITAASFACVSISRDGSKLLVHTAPLPIAVDNVDDQAATDQSSSSPVKSQRKKLSAVAVKPKLLFVNFTPCRELTLAGGTLSSLARGSAVSASYLSPDTVAVATDHGVAIATLADGELWSSKIEPLDGRNVRASMLKKGDLIAQDSPHNIPAGPIHTIISIGGVGNRPGIIYVENHAVYTCRLGTASISNNPNNVLVKKVDLHDPMLLCQLHGKKVPWRATRSTRMSNFVDSVQSMKCPPRLISSPSGRYLCLYWEDEKSYEILHAGSLLARDQNNPAPPNSLENRGRVTPSVDSGNHVLSFAWVGEDDNFAVLRQNVDPVRTNHGSQDSSLGDGPKLTPSPEKVKPGRPKVELFKLAEVKVDAVELAAGASVAAATTVSLGSLTVRGGDRVVPNVLFGGPSLCVGCISVPDRSNDVAYFYSRKSGTIENNDERASTYVTLGTSIPYPDLVSWDDIGRLCAASYGTRVAVYLSEKSTFILLGSVQVVTSESTEEVQPLVSMKFIHGALYLSTQSSVHVIFLGNLDEEDTVCELDIFTIATDDVPLYGTDNPHISCPVPPITALVDPYILAYHSGGLLVSTRSGLRLLPLSHPTIRIGTLLAANLIDRARKWIVAMPKTEHDSLAQFLIRRGRVDLAMNDLNGLSLETYIDLCIRYEHTDDLERLIESHGSEIIPEICDWGRSGTYSAYFAICLYMLGKGKVESVKKMIAYAAESGITELLVDAMKLSTFVSVVDQPEGNALLQKVTDAMDFNANGQLALVNS